MPVQTSSEASLEARQGPHIPQICSLPTSTWGCRGRLQLETLRTAARGRTRDAAILGLWNLTRQLEKKKKILLAESWMGTGEEGEGRQHTHAKDTERRKGWRRRPAVERGFSTATAAKSHKVGAPPSRR